MNCPKNIRDKISMNHKKGNHKKIKSRHRHDVMNHVMSLLSWWTLGQGVWDFVVRHRRDIILTDRAKCKVKDANLELVTAAECVRADGTALAPGFIFSGGSIQPSWARGSPDGNIT